ncbi:MAG: MmgE/PrpD family protein [Deltaproteobacteria bacterium]|nr:MmgE/PrpD family protein [Deltaproteobacteria bacterium]
MATYETIDENPYTRGIASFVSGLRYEEIPEEVRNRIKLLILDSLGCALYASRLPWSRIVVETLRRLDTSSACTVWGTSEKLSAPHAALVNGTMVQGYEIDDVHRKGILHVGAVTLPAIMAIAEMRPRMSGKDFLTAAVAGYEIGPRVGMCMGPEHIGQGWHSGATTGVFSAAGGAASALGLSEEKAIHAIGIAGTQSSGLMAAQYGAMVKRMHAGRASQSGLYGALLAENGFTGIVNVFESPYGGFCTTFSRSSDRFDLSELTSGLGKRYETMNISLKFYSCAATNHTTLDSLRAMQKTRPFKADEVNRIRVWGHQITVDHVGWPYRPQGVTAAQLNLPFCVATLLLEGDVFVDQFSEEMVSNPARMALAEKVEVIHDPKITAMGREFRHLVRVKVELRDGTVLKESAEDYRGSEKNFGTDADIINKFEKLVCHILPHGQVDRLRDTVLGLEKVERAMDLAHLLVTT